MTMTYFHEDEDKDEDIVIKKPRGRGQHEDTKIAVLGPRGRGHEDEDPKPGLKLGHFWRGVRFLAEGKPRLGPKVIQMGLGLSNGYSFATNRYSTGNCF